MARSVLASAGPVRVRPCGVGQADGVDNRRLPFSLLLTLVIPSALACRGMEPIDPPPALDAVGQARVALGRALFVDPDLSADGTVPCSSCHRPEHGGAEPLAVSEGIGGARGRRNAPSVFNASLKFAQFWDGRVETLDAQALGPLYAADEMGLDAETLVARLSGSATYPAAFARAFPNDPDPIRPDNVAAAIAAYERRLAWPGRVDRFLQGDESALSSQERAGYDYFAGNCAFCHDGPGVGGQRIEKLGDQVPWPEDRAADRGRAEVTNEPGDDLRFVVPSLRHVGQTAPYFHDGSVETLEEAVRLMAKHQLDETLTEQQVTDLVAFLRAIDGEIPEAELGAQAATP